MSPWTQYFTSIAATVLFLGCANSNPPLPTPASTAPQPSNQNTEQGTPTASREPVKTIPNSNALDETRYEQLLALDDEILLSKAAGNDLGNCRLVKVSEGGCAATSSVPLYQIRFESEGKYFPETWSNEPSKYCWDRAASDLRSALQEGFCFENHLPWDKISDQGLARRALFGELGNCQLTVASLGGCAGTSTIPLFLIHLVDRNVNFPKMSSEKEDQFCFNNVGASLRDALQGGFCFAH
ncbi:MAG: hypothetical protein ACXWP5_12595 [Bdellovibrionota bacterium]